MREDYHSPNSTRILSPRQIEILESVDSGLSSKEVAKLYGISEQTVKNHLSKIYSKLGSSNRIEAINQGHAQGYLKPFNNFEIANRLLDEMQEYLNQKRLELAALTGATQ